MNYLENWREYISDKERLYSLLALVAIMAIGLGDFLFVISPIIPQLRVRKTLVSQLASAEKDLMDAKKAQSEAPER
ncbi:MAG: hypothetical protein OEW09_13890, partial [Anaerolineae bacterium]|nr:hypothetical protein [Anaerolineae bacterium]